MIQTEADKYILYRQKQTNYKPYRPKQISSYQVTQTETEIIQTETDMYTLKQTSYDTNRSRQKIHTIQTEADKLYTIQTEADIHHIKVHRQKQVSRRPTGRNIHHVQTDNCHRQKHTPCSDRQLSQAVLSFQSDQDWSNPSSRVLTNPVSGVKVSGSMIRGVPRLSHQTARASGLNHHRIS